MFIIIHKTNTLRRIYKRALILKMSFPATSYVAATFHPTIGQLCSSISQHNCHPRAGHNFTRKRGGKYSNPRANSVKRNVNERTHKISTTYFDLCTQSFNSSKSWLKQLMHGEWKSMAVKICIGASHHF